MAQYRQVHTRIWGNSAVQEVSANAKLLFVYLITCSHRNEAGLFPITMKTIARETDLKAKTVEAVFAELTEQNLASYDPATGECLIVSAVNFSPYQNDRTLKSVARTIIESRSIQLQKLFVKTHYQDKRTGLKSIMSIIRKELPHLYLHLKEHCSNSVPTEYISLSLASGGSGGKEKIASEVATAEEIQAILENAKINR